MLARHPRDTAARRAYINNSGRFQNILVVLLILCLCITSAKALEPCVNGKPEEGLNACPCDKSFSMEPLGHLRRRDMPPFLRSPSSPPMVISPYSTYLFPVGSEGLTYEEKCALTRRCQSKPQCCIELCESDWLYPCMNENDCRAKRQDKKFWACINQQKCLQWNDSRCDTGGMPSYLKCFCRKYDRSCA